MTSFNTSPPNDKKRLAFNIYDLSQQLHYRLFNPPTTRITRLNQ